MELFGEFKFERSTESYKYIVTKVIDWTLAEDGVFKVFGDHLVGRSNKDVDGILFNNIKMKHFPRLLGQFFPNLKTLMMNSCEVRYITSYDFVGLRNLQQLSMNGNKIIVLPNALFEETPAIEAVSFYGNMIKFIDPNIFDSLPNLKHANFKLNTNIDACHKTVGNGISLDCLKEIILENCQPKNFGMGRYFQQLMENGRLEWKKQY